MFLAPALVTLFSVGWWCERVLYSTTTIQRPTVLGWAFSYAGSAHCAGFRALLRVPTVSGMGFLEALNGLFQPAKRRARGFKRMSTIRTVIFLIAGKLDFHMVNPHAHQPT